jgi:hypothetical protein
MNVELLDDSETSETEDNKPEDYILQGVRSLHFSLQKKKYVIGHRKDSSLQGRDWVPTFRRPLRPSSSGLNIPKKRLNCLIIED